MRIGPVGALGRRIAPDASGSPIIIMVDTDDEGDDSNDGVLGTPSTNRGVAPGEWERHAHAPGRQQDTAQTTRPPARDGTAGNNPCSSRRAGFQAPNVQARGRWIDPSWWQRLKVHSNPWESPNSPCGGFPSPSHFKPRSEVYMTLGSHRARHAASLPRGALDPWESSDLPCGNSPSQSRFSSVVRA